MLLAGPSGSGKSTLLRALAGVLLTADVGDLSGTVELDGRDPQATPGQVALLLYRRFGLPTAFLAGAAAGAAGAVYEWLAYWQGYAWTFKLVYLGSYALSGAVIAGVGGWLITRALARAGALNALPPGREALEHRAT